MKRVFIMAHETARANAIQAVQNAPEGYTVTIAEPNRTLEQNALQWPILEAFADQLQWPVNGQMVWMTPEEWKDVLTAAFKRETARIAMGLDGGVVMLGMRTSKMGKKQFSEWIDFIKATAALRDVDIDYMDHA